MRAWVEKEGTHRCCAWHACPILMLMTHAYASPSATATAAAAVAVAASASASAAGTSIPAAAGSPHVESSIQVPPAPTASDAKKAKKQPSKRERARVVDSEEELKEDPAGDLQSKGKRKKPKIDKAFEKALGDDSAWEHEVDPLRVAFPADFDYRKALNAGLTSAPVKEALTKMPPEQLLGESYLLLVNKHNTQEGGGGG
ncbi:hypothetical protein PIB30_043901 [Stylosanthes scabra]|uniref:Uncharacterized protein n=1 Tax=Stylosanthes scabra TaxID=79078 RepID=A0ABU6TGN1_9FABA|nr:hypothetical protein [Stylosanthes scabra]